MNWNLYQTYLLVHTMTSNDYFAKFIYLNNRMQYLTGKSLLDNDLNIYGKPRNKKCNHVVKEICENISALTAVTNYMPDALDDDNILCLAIGDGKQPRAGILFALSTKWNVISIDPIMDDKWLTFHQENLPNLKCVKATATVAIDNIDFNKYACVVIVGVHSHADMFEVKKEVSKKSDARILIIYIPCCKGIPRQFNKNNLVIDKYDPSIPSTKNRLLIWDYPTEHSQYKFYLSKDLLIGET